MRSSSRRACEGNERHILPNRNELRKKRIGNFLVDAAPATDQINLAVLLLFANGALTMTISIVAWRVLRQYSSATALLLLMISVIMFTFQALDNAHILAMVSLSQRHVASPGESLDAVASVLGATRKWTHYSELVAVDAWIVLFHCILYRFALVPRLAAAFGDLNVLLHFGALLLPMILGHAGIVPLGSMMALSHVIVAGWLMSKGFAEQPPADNWPTPSQSPVTE